MRDLYSTAIDDLLAQECKPDLVRRIEQGADWRPLWECLEESGFADSLVPEREGGAGLPLRDMFVVFERCGAHALPLPFGETLLARALLSAAGMPVDARPSGPVTFAPGWRDGSGLRCDVVPGARTAAHVLVQAEDGWRLLDVASASAGGAGFALDLALAWPRDAVGRAVALTLAEPWSGLAARTLQACIHAALLAGAASRVFEATLTHANQRTQFGRVIGKFQAVQHHLAVMAEQVAAARVAAEIGCLSDRWAPEALHAALAKARTSEAALDVARLAHQVHGAIGFTEELDLQLYTRRLHAWRRAGGSESGWHDRIGRALVDHHPGRAVDLARSMLHPVPEATP
jgi:acyl-CoA dehydrogenase